MSNQSIGIAELWIQWRVADTRLHRIAAASQCETTPPAGADLVRRCHAHADASRKRNVILKRLALRPAARWS